MMKIVVILMCVLLAEAEPQSAAARFYRDRLFKFTNELAIQQESQKHARDIPEYRLPVSLNPSHQLIRLQPFVNGNSTFNGYTELSFDVVSPTSSITIHMYNIQHDSDSVTVEWSGAMGIPLSIANQTYDPIKKFFIVELDEDLEGGESYILKMNYVGELADSVHGFYLTSYTDSNGEEKNLAVTQFEATDARNAFPCFDEPSFKATFTTEIIREEGMVAMSNMPLNSSEPWLDQPGWVLDKFETTVRMSSYLNAFQVSDFVQKNSTVSDIVYRVWAPEHLIDTANYSLSVVPVVTSFFEDYFKVDYPLPKQDMTALPDSYFGAMENWGLITYRFTAMLYHEDFSAIWDKQSVCRIVAHELVHMWFGNIVTLEWWEYIWLNEGFANYFETVGCDSAEPTFQQKELHLIQEMQYVLGIDDVESSHPLVLDLNDPNTILFQFDSISYSKGGSLVRMMKYFLGESTFISGLTNYLNTFSYSNANQDDLFAVLNDQAVADGALEPAGLTVKDIMDTWTLQKGYPVVNVTRFSDGTALLMQERFLMTTDSNSNDTFDYKWHIPITYATGDNPNFDDYTVEWMLLNETEKTISNLPALSEWVQIFNIQELGYFRVNYDEDNWNAIIQQLKTDHSLIHFLNRAQLLNDAYNLARAGYISYETPFNINTYLGNETEYLVIKASLQELDYIERMFRRSPDYESFKGFLLDILLPIYEDVGFVDSKDDSFLDQTKREEVVSWVCYLDHEPCLANSTNLYGQLMVTPDDYTIITPNSKYNVYCSSIKEGGETEWDFAFAKYTNSNFTGERTDLIYAMGCSKELWILTRYLEMAFNGSSGVDMNDASDVVSAIASNVDGEDLAWQYIRDNDENIASYMGSYSVVADLVRSVSRNFNTREKLQELEQFKIDNEVALTNSSSSIDGPIDSTEYNIQWMDAYYNVIVQWLESNNRF